MKVVLIYRKRRPDAYSIEGLFHSLAKELRKHVQIIEYEISFLWFAWLDAWRLRKLNPDLYHVTGDIQYITLLLPRQKTVLTVHDIGHLVCTLSGIKKWVYKWIWTILPICYAKSVTVISEATREAIRSYLGIRRPLAVVPNCYAQHFRQSGKKSNGNVSRILQIGTGQNKNLFRVIEAIKDLECRLVIVGKLDELALAKLAKGRISYESYCDLAPEQLIEQYVLSDIVCFVSVYEGFGLPILEAQIIGRPVITSRKPPMCDVAGDAACLVDPYDVSAIRNGIRRLLTNEEYRCTLVERGYLNAAKYSPEIVASQYWAVYRNTAQLA